MPPSTTTKSPPEDDEPAKTNALDQTTFLARRYFLATPPPGFRIFSKQNRFFLGACFLLLCVAYYFTLTGGVTDLVVSINKHRTPGRDSFFKIITKFGEPEAYAVLVGIFCLVRFRSAIFVVLTGAAAGIITGILKTIFGHARPLRYIFDNDEPLWYTLSRFDESFYHNSWAYTSFPSGHAASAFAIFSFLAFNANRFKIPVAILCFLFASLVAISRMYLLMHFLKDVTVGATLGILIAMAMFHLQFKVFPKREGLDRGLLTRF